MPLSQIAQPCGPDASDVLAACEDIVASSAFAKAPRMCQLLQFLVEKMLAGRGGEVNEYAIGLEVFGRDPRSYDTTVDPLVRVQMSRLRERLALYYASEQAPDVRIVIPLGSYLPQVRRPAPVPAETAGHTLELTPLVALEHDAAHAAFVRGLDEELRSHLFIAFAGAIRLCEAHAAQPRRRDGRDVCQRLEGTIRVESDHVRASVRLVDAANRGIRWVCQYDGRGRLDMALQEQLAGAICTGLRQHLHEPAAAPQC